MADFQQEVLEYGNHRTFVNIAGKGAQEAILFLHGSGPGANAWSNWQFAAPFFKDRYFVVAPDLAGFGKSAAPKPFPPSIRGWMKHWTDQLLRLLDHLELDKVHLVGNSMGGGVALHLLAQNPERFHRVVLMGPVGTPVRLTPELDLIWGFYDDPGPSQERLEQTITWFGYSEALLSGNQLKEIAKIRLAAAIDPAVREAFVAMFPRPRQAILDDVIVPDTALGRIMHPVLIVAGRDDKIIPLESSYQLFERLGGPVQLHVWAQCRHWIQIEYRDSFHTLVSNFLAGRQ